MKLTPAEKVARELLKPGVIWLHGAYPVRLATLMAKAYLRALAQLRNKSNRL